MSRALPADLDCIVAVEQVTDYLEGALPPHARTEFEQHLVTCPGCVTYSQAFAGRQPAGWRVLPVRITEFTPAQSSTSRIGSTRSYGKWISTLPSHTVRASSSLGGVDCSCKSTNGRRRARNSAWPASIGPAVVWRKRFAAGTAARISPATSPTSSAASLIPAPAPISLRGRQRQRMACPAMTKNVLPRSNGSRVVCASRILNPASPTAASAARAVARGFAAARASPAPAAPAASSASSRR
ncbi:MAG: zf-HC2 domain-containing protein [Deltaproteobacteria bacterium]|nr:MAG: zf-HC2 domain-containing protein [Deltaproteobacteria bacterium]